MTEELLNTLMKLKEYAGIFVVNEDRDDLVIKKANTLSEPFKAWLSLPENNSYVTKIISFKSQVAEMLELYDVDNQTFAQALTELTPEHSANFDRLLNQVPGLQEILQQESKVLIPIKQNCEQDEKYENRLEAYLKDADNALIKKIYDIYSYDLKHPEENILSLIQGNVANDSMVYQRVIGDITDALKDFFTKAAQAQLNPIVFAQKMQEVLEKEYIVDKHHTLTVRSFLTTNIYPALAKVHNVTAAVLLKEEGAKEEYRRQKFMRTPDMPVKANVDVLKQQLEQQNLINELTRIKNFVKRTDVPLKLNDLFSGFAGEENTISYIKSFIDNHTYFSDQRLADDINDLFENDHGADVQAFLTKNLAAILKKIITYEKQDEVMDFLWEMYPFFRDKHNAEILDELKKDPRKTLVEKLTTTLEGLYSEKFENVTAFKSKALKLLNTEPVLQAMLLMNKPKIHAFIESEKVKRISSSESGLQSVATEHLSKEAALKAMGATVETSYTRPKIIPDVRSGGVINYIKNNPLKFIAGISIGMVFMAAFVVACVLTGGSLAATFPVIAPLILKVVALADLISLPGVAAIGAVAGGILGALVTTALDKIADGFERIIRAVIFAIRSTDVKPVNKGSSEDRSGEQVGSKQNLDLTNKARFKHDFIEDAAKSHQNKEWRHKEGGSESKQEVSDTESNKPHK